jgi:hypothetical protein
MVVPAVAKTHQSAAQLQFSSPNALIESAGQGNPQGLSDEKNTLKS